MRTVDPVKHAAKKRHITDTAAGLFAEKGYDRTTVADICRAAGISTGSLFHYFPTKRAIFREIFEQDGQDNAEVFARAAELSPWDGVLMVVDHLCVPALDRSVAGLVLEVVMQASRDPELWELVGRNEQVVRDGLARLLQNAHDAGQIALAVDARTAASWAQGLVDGLFGRLVDPDFDAADQVSTLRLILSRFVGAQAP
ncbi:TetR/AcrR family transcriptional regulator [Lentzea sp. BCCO 10_0856]|uniref:TetR/AcrR family transcriptional regulator n=1 Tax=Lentzea miocenica TaxID=3095431 RepID=A0ABU4TBS6_9PSEU|nr:TetR/AcrR family transcriptional regulator [Lentzea sp. BCCO 10_0856]MDX8035606.1 TetR/AcrR family transcriptional regulator [Lentzea sp. BCCO 10_0856]